MMARIVKCIIHLLYIYLKLKLRKETLYEGLSTDGKQLIKKTDLCPNYRLSNKQKRLAIIKLVMPRGPDEWNLVNGFGQL